MFGWYYEEGPVQGTSDNYDDAVGEAVESGMDIERVLVGPMRDIDAADLIDVDDVLGRARDVMYDSVIDGEAELRGDLRDAERELAAWCRKFLSPHPSSCCDGARVPTEYREGEWCLPSEHDAMAYVTYASEPSPETGRAGWQWWALGRMGEASSYADAKSKAEAKVREILDLEHKNQTSGW